ESFGASGDVVQALLLGLHACLGFGERGGAIDFGGLEADQFKQYLAVGEVAVETFLEWAIVLSDELRVLLGAAGGEGFQFGEDLFDAGGLNAGEDLVLLQDLARDVERKVFGVDDAADEAEILREELLGVVHDEDALDVELDAGLVVGLVEIQGSLGWNVEESSVLKGAFGASVEPEERIFPVSGEGLVELLVVVVGEFGLGALPHGRGGVDLLGDAGFNGLLLVGVPFTLVVSEEDGEGDVVGVLLDDLLEPVPIRVLCTFFVEVEQDGGSSGGPFGRLYFEASLAVGDPFPRLVFASLARYDFHLVGDHEGGVEAYAELADEVGVLALVAGELREEVLGSRACDGSEMRHEVLLVHAEASVGDGDGLGVFVELEVNARGINALAS